MLRIRSIFRFLNPLLALRAMPRICATILISIAMLIAHYAWSIHCIKLQQKAVGRLNAAGLVLPHFAHNSLAPELNSAKYYNRIETLFDAYEAANSSAPLADSETGRQIIGLLVQAQNLQNEFTADFPYTPVRLMRICSTLAISSGDPKTAELCLNASRKILKHAWVIPIDSRHFVEHLSTLQILAAGLKPNDPLKAAVASLIHDLEDKTPYKDYCILQIVGFIYAKNQNDPFSIFRPLKDIRLALETENALLIAKPLFQFDNIPSFNYLTFPVPSNPPAAYPINSLLNERYYVNSNANEVHDHFINIPRVRLTQAALAFQLHRIDHGDFPKTAKELVPEYLPESFNDDRYRLVLLTTPDRQSRPFIAETVISYDAHLTQVPFFEDRTFADLTLPPATNPINLIPKPTRMK